VTVTNGGGGAGTMMTATKVALAVVDVEVGIKAVIEMLEFTVEFVEELFPVSLRVMLGIVNRELSPM
jgi:hypothetical protein